MKPNETIPEYLAEMARNAIENGEDVVCGYRTTSEVASHFDISEGEARATLKLLAIDGVVEEVGLRSVGGIVWRPTSLRPGAVERPKKPITAYHYQPGNHTRYCHGCSTMKTMGDKSSRCEECAQKHKEIDDARVMPDRFLGGSTLNYSVDHLIGGGEWKMEHRRPLAEGERALGWLILPPFQRPRVWTLEQKVKLIESVWLELPIGAYVYNQTGVYKHPTDRWLVDGQQRISTLLEYVDDGFAVYGYRWSELSALERSIFGSKTFPAIQLDITDPAMLEDIYNRLAYGGTAHEPKEPA